MDVSVNDDLYEKVLVFRTFDYEMKWKKVIVIFIYVMIIYFIDFVFMLIRVNFINVIDS